MDVDGDGNNEIFHPSGFLPCEANPLAGGPCGAISWYKKAGNSWQKTPIYKPSDSKLFYWQAVFTDFNKDGILDFITVGERKPTSGKSTAQVLLFKGTKTSPYFETKPFELGQGLGSLPVGRDIDGDGDIDIFSAEYFLPAADFGKFSFAWFEQIARPE
jgi:hypothetical protein